MKQARKRRTAEVIRIESLSSQGCGKHLKQIGAVKTPSKGCDGDHRTKDASEQTRKQSGPVLLSGKMERQYDRKDLDSHAQGKQRSGEVVTLSLGGPKCSSQNSEQDYIVLTVQ